MKYITLTLTPEHNSSWQSTDHTYRNHLIINKMAADVATDAVTDILVLCVNIYTYSLRYIYNISCLIGTHGQTCSLVI